MSEIKNYTMNFSSGRSLRDLNVLRTLAFTEIHRLQCATVGGFGKVQVK
jgi:hypothetical protein